MIGISNLVVRSTVSKLDKQNAEEFCKEKDEQ